LHGTSVKYNVYTPVVKEVIKEMNDPNAMLPEYVVTAGEIDPIDRVLMQAAWQQHIDAAISSTVNLPYTATLENVRDIYIAAWKRGLKGITVFRDGCARLGVLTIDESKKEEETAVYTPKLERGVWKKKAKDTKYDEVKVRTGCGKLTIMVGYSKSERALQDFYVIRSGKGGCERTIQDLVIAMSAVIRLGGSLENLEKGFDGIGTCNSFTAVRTKGLKTLSSGNNCGEAILNAIRSFCKAIKEEEELKIPEYLPAVRVDFYGLPVMISQGICPECGTSMMAESGCFTCKSCGFSRCG
jgi:ribonucleoside-diphosphate reductase alpha chain